MCLEFDLFSDFFARRENFLQRLDCRLKLVIALAGTGAVLASSQPVFPVLIFGPAVVGLLLLRLPANMVMRRYLPVLGMALALLALHGFMFGSHPIFTIPLGPCCLTLFADGLRHGVVAAVRLLTAFTVLLLLGVVTPAHDLFRALAWLRLPRQWVEIAMMTYRYIFVLLDDAADIAAAQKIRLGYVGPRRGLASLSVLAGSVLIRALDQSRRTHEAMIARAYTQELPFAPMPVLSVKSMAATVFFLIIIAAFYWVCEGRMLI